ncbi:MAG: response regulator [Planctomycetia bacterium]
MSTSTPGFGSQAERRAVLLIEDDQDIAEGLAYNLIKEGYDADVVGDGREGVARAKAAPPDLIILDLMLPSIDGVEVCRMLRADSATKAIPILMLTAKSEEVDQIIGFSVGADDYVTKPFSVKVLLQRVRVLMQRSRGAGDEPESSDNLERHGILLDRLGHQVFCMNRPVSLTPTEFRLLETLMRQPGRAFTRADLLDSAIGDETIVLERTIDVHVRSLRHKLGKCARVIETVRGVGYRFARDLR